MPKLINNELARVGSEAGYPTAEARASALGGSRIHLLNIEQGKAAASEALIGRMAGLYSKPGHKVTREKIKRMINKARKAYLRRTIKSI